MDNYTKNIAEFVAQARYDRIQPEALHVAKTAIVDCIGVSLAGSKEECVRICARLAREETSNRDATVIGQGFKSSVLMAALCNGTAAHALDFDHGFPHMGQPTAGLMPAILSLGEKLRAKGRDLIEAYVVGFEVTARLARSMPDLSSKGSWHAAGTIGTIGSAVACAKLLGLNALLVQCTLGIASSMASGTSWNHGTMTKPLHAGLAARNGVLAARLAQEGFSANPNIFEKHKGFCDVYSRSLHYDLSPFDSIGISFDLVEKGIIIKPYPCAGLSHTAIDSILILRAQSAASADEVVSIKVAVTQHVFNRVSGHLPQNSLQGKFSMPYILARAYIDGKLLLDTFTDDAIRDPQVCKLAEKVEIVVDPEIRETNEGERPSEVTLKLKDGRIFSHRRDSAKGSSQYPMTPEELKEKFLVCANRALDRKSAKMAFSIMDHLEDLDNMEALCQLLMGFS